MATETERQRFAQNVMRDFRSLSAYETKGIGLSREASESLRASASAATTGHPMFDGLALNESSHCEAMAMFVDLSQFTSRTFWDSPDKNTRLARSVLGQIMLIVNDFGGYVLGLRGDGVFACFGPSPSDASIPIGLGAAAGAHTLDVVANGLNNLLELDGIQPVRARVGADYGRLDFVRMGTVQASETNVIGFAANFAAKCEKYADAWEFVVGERLCNHIKEKDLLRSHEESPKVYQRDYERRPYAFSLLNWKTLLPHIPGIKAQLDGASAGQVGVQ